MIAKRQICKWLICSLLTSGLILLAACSENSEEQMQGDRLQLLTATRAGDAVTLTTAGASLRMYVASSSSDNPATAVFTLSDSWTATPPISVREDTQYYIYGYMPDDEETVKADNVTVTAPDGGYADGINMTLASLPAVTGNDICLVVGVQRVSDSDPRNENRVCVPEELEEGQYRYFSGVAGSNYANLLLDHLYSQLVLHLNVGADYAKLRNIKLKELKLMAAETVTATVNIRSGSGITYPTYSGSGNKEWSLFSSDNGEELKVSPEVTDLTALSGELYYAPSIFNNKITLRSTYDVYDRRGNLLRQDCTATNEFSVPEMDHGVKKTLTLSVVPTYLYVLSDPDLDSPTLKVSSE